MTSAPTGPSGGGAAISRRGVLRGLLAAAAAGAVGCGGHGQSVGGVPSARVSTSFAESLLDLVEAGGSRASLLRHDALRALVRHQRLSGNGSATPADVLEQALGNVPDLAAARNVLEVWRGREGEIYEAARRAARLLPDGVGFDGTIYLVAGYDIGVAAPPDIALNVAHPHFCARPRELAFYATHEAHHVGFLASRTMPAVSEAVQSRAGLRGLIRFLTQMEGMAVHAAVQGRRDAGALGDDDDYRVYVDGDAAERTRRAFARRWTSIAGDEPLGDEQIGEILNAMSSGERLWYRFGALVSRDIEEREGTRALISSIADAELFWQTATRLMGPIDPAGRPSG